MPKTSKPSEVLVSILASPFWVQEFVRGCGGGGGEVASGMHYIQENALRALVGLPFRGHHHGTHLPLRAVGVDTYLMGSPTTPPSTLPSGFLDWLQLALISSE